MMQRYSSRREQLNETFLNEKLKNAKKLKLEKEGKSFLQVVFQEYTDY